MNCFPLKVRDLDLIKLKTTMYMLAIHIYEGIMLIFFSAPDDFTDKSGIFTFTNTTLTQCVSIVIVDDTVNENSNECFIMTLSRANDSVANSNVATVCITDNGG